jgi:hypothetical protein
MPSERRSVSFAQFDERHEIKAAPKEEAPSLFITDTNPTEHTVALGIIKQEYTYEVHVPLSLAHGVLVPSITQDHQQTDPDLTLEMTTRDNDVHVLTLSLYARKSGQYTGGCTVGPVSVTITAVVMSKQQGMPRLKSYVHKISKSGLYDSAEDTDWQGFDPIPAQH